MSADSKKIYAWMKQYVQFMKDIGKTPGSIAVTQKQFEALKDAHKKIKGPLKGTPFQASYQGIPIQVHHD